jgi:hypothetical protein
MAQWTAGSDVITLAATIAGLALGLGVAHLGADRLLARGQISPQVLRRAGTDRCGLD